MASPHSAAATAVVDVGDNAVCTSCQVAGWVKNGLWADIWVVSLTFRVENVCREEFAGIAREGDPALGSHKRHTSTTENSSSHRLATAHVPVSNTPDLNSLSRLSIPVSGISSLHSSLYHG